MGTLLRIAHKPPTTVSPDVTVLEAVEKMAREQVGAVALVSGERLAGMFTERDLMVKVVLKRLDPTTTRVRDVAVTELITVTDAASEGEALRLMVEHHIRHLPILDGQGRILGMLSVRNVLQDRVDDLTNQLDSLAAYIGADGPGG